MIRQRAGSYFYRQPAGALGDARTLYVNCAFYNIETSAIALKVPVHPRVLAL